MNLIHMFLILVAITVSSCKSISLETDTSHEDGDRYTLISMNSSSRDPSIAEPKGLPWEENYLFTPDNTFVKTRTEDAITITGEGTYTTKIAPEEGTYYILTYTEANPIVGGCTGRSSEHLLLRPDGKLQNTWMMCDGPFMVYEKE